MNPGADVYSGTVEPEDLQVQDSPGVIVKISHFRMNLPHLFWFIFGCSTLWKVDRLKLDHGSGMVRIIIDGPGEIGRISKDDTRDVINLVERLGCRHPVTG